MSTIKERIAAIVKRKRDEESSADFISDTKHDQSVSKCTDQLFKLIVKIEDSKARARKEFPVEVRDRIFLGNYAFASDDEFIQKSNIGLVISCLGMSPQKSFQNVQYEKISIKDQQGEDLLQYSDKVFDIVQNHLKNNSTNIYIHWYIQGKSRSVSVLLMYLMRKEGKQLNELLKDIKQKYLPAELNSWFMKQLGSYKIPPNQQPKSELQPLNKLQNDNHHDLLGFDTSQIQPSTNSTPQQPQIIDSLLQPISSHPLSSLIDYRQHLLIPEHEKSNPNYKNAEEYHLIQIQDEQHHEDLI